MPILHVNGVDLSVSIEGKGPPLLFLHGLGASGRVWSKEVESFKPYFTTVAIDARGHGESARPAHYTLDDHIDDAAGVLDVLGMTDARVVGSSMGSYVAQGLAAKYPARIHSLVLVVPKCHGETSSSARLIAEHADEFNGMTHDEQQEYLLKLSFGPYASEPTRATWISEERRFPLTPPEWASAAAALTGFDLRPALPRVKANTLVMSGRYDRLNTVQDGQACASLISDVEFVEMMRSGHFPNVEEPTLYITLLHEFLAGW
ncbi:3-oxoadipate enol-lactonase (plasmid) [Paraburkholderia sp. PGU19]|uniref:alpha/beta fold hydrolase n=1 Tax=Paraburkholderia sp. PGU19 TaxID=2735434 RepID=UPI0015DB62BC|nr:alpha/beta hydrolase [Paraburkholderia sp. PGU19]BCG04324.1 3-oxoadipate enol-lactonase [Paraburkholderia sp. PGU19]